MTHPKERRRLARIPLTCRIEVGERFSTWVAQTQDVGPRGCRISLTRPVSTGTLLRLSLDAGEGAPPVEALGQVVWTRDEPELEAGVAFTGDVRGGQRGSAWIDALVAAELRRAARETRRLGPLGGVRLHLGSAPGVKLDREAVAVLRGVRRGDPIAALAFTRARLEALLALLGAGTVTTSQANVDPEGWRRAFAVLTDFAREGDEAPPRSSRIIVLPVPGHEERSSSVREIDALVEQYLRDIA